MTIPPKALRAGPQNASKIGCNPQSGFCRIRIEDCNQIPPKTLRAGPQNAWKFGCNPQCGFCRTRSEDCNQFFKLFEAPLSTYLVEFGCNPQCGFCRTRSEECNQIVLYSLKNATKFHQRRYERKKSKVNQNESDIALHEPWNLWTGNTPTTQLE